MVFGQYGLEDGLRVIPFKIPGALLVTHDQKFDERGYFMELYRRSALESHGVPTEWVQENVSLSQAGVLRGMHIQRNNPQGKLITVLRGAIFDAWVDLRPESKTFKQWGCHELFPGGGAIYLPPGLAHGFFTLSEFALVQYKCTTEYDAASDGGIRWDDQEVGIDWPIHDDLSPFLSEKDRALPTIGDWVKEVDLDHGHQTEIL